MSRTRLQILFPCANAVAAQRGMSCDPIRRAALQTATVIRVASEALRNKSRSEDVDWRTPSLARSCLLHAKKIDAQALFPPV
jgi:hypothetical protein